MAMPLDVIALIYAQLAGGVPYQMLTKVRETQPLPTNVGFMELAEN